MKLKAWVSAITVGAAVLYGCDSGSDGVTIIDARPDASRPASSAQIDVFKDNIAAALSDPQSPAPNSLNLYTNPGFENGVNDWTACGDGAISTSTDAYEGDAALELHAGNCFYRSVVVEPGETYTLSCFIKLTTERAWTGMGMVFADSSYRSLLNAPVAVATSGSKYMRLDTHGVAPQGTSSLSMWLHSDFGAVVDNCNLTLQENQTPSPPAIDQNLLSNGTFSESDGQGGASDWTAGCHGVVVSDGTGLFLSDGACVDQALTAEAITAVENSQISYSCLVTEVEGYSDLSVFLDNKLQGFQRIFASDKNTRVALTVNASQPGNGFVSLYSEGHLRVEDCQMVSDGVVIDNNTPDTDVETGTDATTDAGTDTTTDTGTDTTTDTGTDTTTDTGTDTTTDTGTDTTTDAGTDTTTDTGTDTDAGPTVTSARYRLTFNSTWSSQTHPVNYPPPAHFSGLVGAVHNDAVEFWAPGQLATAGIQLMAETGNGSELLSEVATAVANGSAAEEIAGGGVDDTPGSVSIEFEVTTEHPLITVTSMVAPSPDWFIGVHGLSLFDGTNFVDSITRNLSVYDSGTDSGVSFLSANLATQPPMPISLLNSAPTDTDFQNGLPAIGQFVIQKLP